MKKTVSHSYEGHLAIRELSIPAGEEWRSPLNGWSVIQIVKGTGYHLQPQSNQALSNQVLEMGSILLISHGAGASIRASQLGQLTIHTFSVAPSRLTGLMTLVEQSALELAAAKKENQVRILPPDCAAAVRMNELHGSIKKEGFAFRLKLLQLFVEFIGLELEQLPRQEEALDARQRLQMFLNETPSSELLEINFKELARRMHCTSRHLNRLFYQLVGMSFREKRSAIRLERARELLATTDSKIVDVALESGFKSLSLFNLLFARHFDTSPGKWRLENQGRNAQDRNPAGKKSKSFLPSGRAPISSSIKLPPLSSREDSAAVSRPNWSGQALRIRVGV